MAKLVRLKENEFVFSKIHSLEENELNCNCFNSKFFLILDKKEIIGCSKITKSGKNEFSIDFISVCYNHRREGLSTRLIVRMHEWAHSQKYHLIPANFTSENEFLLKKFELMKTIFPDVCSWKDLNVSKNKMDFNAKNIEQKLKYYGYSSFLPKINSEHKSLQDYVVYVENKLDNKYLNSFYNYLSVNQLGHFSPVKQKNNVPELIL